VTLEMSGTIRCGHSGGVNAALCIQRHDFRHLYSCHERAEG